MDRVVHPVRDGCGFVRFPRRLPEYLHLVDGLFHDDAVGGEDDSGLCWPLRVVAARTLLDLVGVVYYHQCDRILRRNSEEEPMSVNVSNMTDKVMTVRGPIDPDELGLTLMHEHLFIALYKGIEPDDNTPATD